MLYFMETPLTEKCTVFESNGDHDVYGEPSYTVSVKDCLIFEESKKIITSDGSEATSNTCVILKDKPVFNSFIYLGETAETDPKSLSCFQVLKIDRELDITDNATQGYSVYL